MTFYQPFLFVGIGGTGCAIGAELERRVREIICGPDGAQFQQLRADARRYELPAFTQFVYADFNQADLDRLPQSVVPGSQHIPAAELTAHYARGLIPQFDSFPEVALSLRLSVEAQVDPWLPPAKGEPRVLPLQRGAGQLPTVGRASFYATIRDGVHPATAPLAEALSRLSGHTAREDLYRLSGPSTNTNSVDVFVAFSVAGGTGSGIFYDYLHLIGWLFARHPSLQAKIYPLVLMPSAFTEGNGGGRPALLNASRSLLDLFRLVDQQNGGGVQPTLHGHETRAPVDTEEVAVHYPVEGRIRMRPGLAQTAFLFSRPLGTETRDLRRSVVSLVLALVGTEFDPARAADGEHHQSFADSFINGTVDRQIPAENGIGDRGVSTAQVASLTVPVDELADIIAAKLLGEGIEDLAQPLAGAESNRDHIKDFFVLSGLKNIFDRIVPAPSETEDATGAQQIINALGDRLAMLRLELDQLQAKLQRTIPEMVAGFDPRHAVVQLLDHMDPFRVQRVIAGHAAFTDEVDKIGARGLMNRRRSAPPAPAGFREAPPTPPVLRDGLFRGRAKWHDPEPARAREAQDTWYQWRGRVLWTEPWSTLAPRWTRQLDQAEAVLAALTQALHTRASEDREQSDDRAAALYAPRVGVSFLLPPGGSFDQFYDKVVRHITEELVTAGLLPANATAAQRLAALIDADGWREAFGLAGENQADAAVGLVRDQIKSKVKRYLENTELGRTPLLPKLHELLSEAARPTGRFAEDDIEEFRSKLSGLVPADFLPQGTGSLKVLVSYASPTPSAVVESYLRGAVALPEGPGITYEFKPTTAESVTVVLFRSAMGITDVREVREVLRTWAKALDRPEPQDYLKWRQRTGYRSGYLVTTGEHRVRILHRLLSALWNGKVSTSGDPHSPESITVTLSGGVEMTLALQPLRRASSWADLPRAYEMWTFADNESIRREFCAQLMRETPEPRGRPRPPAKLYGLLRGLADQEIAYLAELARNTTQTAGQVRARRYLEFWEHTLPTALALPFDESNGDLGSLLELEEDFGQDGSL